MFLFCFDLFFLSENPLFFCFLTEKLLTQDTMLFISNMKRKHLLRVDIYDRIDAVNQL